MTELRIVTTAGTDVGLDDPAIEELGTMLRGELLRPEDGGYEDARKVYNAMIDKRPALIVRCADVADVIAAVNFARENDMLGRVASLRPTG